MVKGTTALVVFFYSLISATAHAASLEASRLRLGPVSGISQSTLRCESCDEINMGSRSGVGLGLQLEWVWFSHLSIEGEVLYLQKGVRQRHASNAPDSLVNFNTLEFPIHLKTYWGERGFRGGIFAGPQLGIAITRTIELAGSPASDLPAAAWDFGFHLGAGVDIKIGENAQLILQGRFNFGLKDLDVGVLEESARSFGFLVLSGVKFGV